MSENTTENESLNTSEDEGKNTGGSTGVDDAGTSNEQDQQKETKTFTQADIDRIVKSAKIDAEKAAKAKLEKSYEGKHILTDDELTAKVKEALDAERAAQALATVKASIKTEYGLTDKQIERLTGDNEKELRKDAEEVFGSLKQKQPPILQGGNNDTTNTTITDEDTQVANALKNAAARIGRR